jgi:hypothetical protein
MKEGLVSANGHRGHILATANLIDVSRNFVQSTNPFPIDPGWPYAPKTVVSFTPICFRSSDSDSERL